MGISGETAETCVIPPANLKYADEISCGVISDDACVANGEVKSDVIKGLGEKPVEGIADPVAVNNQLHVFPVPATDKLQLHWNGAASGKMNVQVCDLDGRVVAVHTADVQTGTTTSIPVQELAAGVYCLRATVSEHVLPVQRFVKR